MSTRLFCAITLILYASAKKIDPLFQYRYQSEDLMQHEASSLPLRGFHVAHGGYYPETNFQDYYQFRPPFRQHGYNGFGHGHSPGGEYFDKNYYNHENKHLNDGTYEKSSGEKGEHVNHEEEGYNKGNAINKNAKADSGYYTEEDGEKKSVSDGKYYQGGQYYNKKGENEGENKEKGSHKKGHKIKGFKTTHHKDEDGKTEEYYDEEHDEGDKFNYGGQSGSYDENKKAGYKGGHDTGEFNSEQKKKQGNYDSHHSVDNSKGNEGEYEQKKYLGNQASHGSHKGVDEQALHKHQESDGAFKHHPYHVPFSPER